MKVCILTLLISLVLITNASPIDIFKTSLKVTVRDGLGNIVTDAEVKLFPTRNDFINETNLEAQTITNHRGVARFKALPRLTYFILVRKGQLDNFSGGVETKLEKNRFNKITIIVE